MRSLGITGYAGSGFSEKGLKEAIERMKPLFTVKSPFVNPPKIKEKIQWLQPKLVCEIEYAELTADEQLRQTRVPLLKSLAPCRIS
jgi:bifunctional non-homologous end joining protein LigD